MTETMQCNLCLNIRRDDGKPCHICGPAQVTLERMHKTNRELIEALQKIRKGMPNCDGDYYDGWAHEYRLIADAAITKATT